LRELLDDNDRAVAGLIEAYDLLAQRADAYLERLKPQLDEANATGDPRYIGRVERGIGFTQTLIDLLDEGVLNVLMELRHSQHHIRLGREGKIV
jgi:hypothetical protein